MSMQDARDLLRQVEKDKALAAELESAQDRNELIRRLKEQANIRGFSVTEDDLRLALDEMSPPYDVLLM